MPTDKARLDWLLNSDTPYYADCGTGYILHIRKILHAKNSLTYRQAVDAAMKAERVL